MAVKSKHSTLEYTLGQLEGLIAWKRQQDADEEKRQVNVRLNLGDLELLDALAEHYEESRTSMAQHILSSAIVDALQIAGINADEVWKRAQEEKGRLE